MAHQAIHTLVLVFQPALLTDYERLDWHTLCSALLGHARSNLLLDVMFDAVRTLYRMVSPLSVVMHAQSYHDRKSAWLAVSMPYLNVSCASTTEPLAKHVPQHHRLNICAELGQAKTNPLWDIVPKVPLFPHGQGHSQIDPGRLSATQAKPECWNWIKAAACLRHVPRSTRNGPGC